MARELAAFMNRDTLLEPWYVVGCEERASARRPTSPAPGDTT